MAINSNYENIRKNLTSKVKDLNASLAPVVQQTSNEELKSLFANLITARDEFSAEFNLLFAERLKIYETFISLIYIHIFNSRIQNLSINFKYYFELLMVVNTSKFIATVDDLLKIYTNSITQNSSGALNLYFDGIFNSLKEIVYPEISIEFPNTTTLRIKKTAGDLDITTLNVDDQIIQDQILFTLFALKNADLKDYVSRNSSFLRGTKEGSFLFQVKTELENSLKQIESYVASYSLIDFYLKEKDTNYTDEYIMTIKDTFTQLEDIISTLSDFSIEGLNLLIQTGQMDRFYNTIADLNLKAQDIVFDAIQSLKLIETVIEDYSPFIEMPVNGVEKLQASLDIIDTITFVELEGTSIINPFVVEPYLTTIKFKTWKDDLLETGLINPDLFNLVILRTGIFLSRESFSSISGEELITFSLLRMIDRKLISESTLSSLFKTNKNIQDNLMAGIQIKPRFQDDIISFSFKQIFPSLEVLDYMSFDEVNNDFESIALSTFKENILVLILEAFLKKRSEIDLLINRIIDVLKTSNFDNLKSLFIKICFYEVIHRLISYLNESISSSNISATTLENMKKLISEEDIEDNTEYMDIKNLIERYVTVWNYLYNSDEEETFVDRVITDAELKNLLK
jgi:hypothetical protein